MFKKITFLAVLMSLVFCMKVLGQCSSPVSLPYFNGFENITVDSIPTCFKVQTASPNSIIEATVRSGTAFEGTKYLTLTNGSLSYADCNAWIFLPAMDFVANKNYNVSFQYRGFNNKPVNEYPFEIFYGAAPTIAAMSKIVGTTKFWPNNYTSFNASFSPEPTEKYIAIHYRSSPDNGNALYIDNLTINENILAPCNGLSLAVTSPCCVGNASITATASQGINKIIWYKGGNAVAVQNGTCEPNATTYSGGNGSGANADQLNNPFGIIQDRSGNLYVADAGNNRIQKFTPGSTNGITVAGGNGSGAAANQLNNPRGVFVDSSGTLYIADAGNNRIQKWVANATFGSTVAGGNGQGNAANQLDAPQGIFVNSTGNIYIADGNNGRVQRWLPSATTGTTVAGGNGSGADNNQLTYITGIYADATGNVYVSDFNNNRVMRWAPNSFSGMFAAGENGAGAGAGQLDAPRGLYVDCSGNVYVADQNNHRVQKWAPGALNPVTIAGGNGAGAAANQLNSPSAIYVDDKGNVFVTDRLNNRVQQFTLKNTATYTPLNGGAYTAVVSSTGCCTSTSQAVIINQANGPTLCPGSNTYFVSGAGMVNTYQWQVNTGAGFVNIGNNTFYSGTLNDTLQLSLPPSGWYGYTYRCQINGSAYSPEYALKFAVTWTGSNSTAWENPANWNCGIMPDENTDVTVNNAANYYPQVNTNAACGSLKLMPGAAVTVKTGMKLEVKRTN